LVCCGLTAKFASIYKRKVCKAFDFQLNKLKYLYKKLCDFLKTYVACDKIMLKAKQLEKPGKPETLKQNRYKKECRHLVDAGII
jgi:hypothetical protein